MPGNFYTYHRTLETDRAEWKLENVAQLEAQQTALYAAAQGTLTAKFQSQLDARLDAQAKEHKEQLDE